MLRPSCPTAHTSPCISHVGETWFWTGYDDICGSQELTAVGGARKGSQSSWQSQLSRRHGRGLPVTQWLTDGQARKPLAVTFMANEVPCPGSHHDAKITPVWVPILPLPKSTPYSGGTSWLILEWLGIGGLQCLDCGDAPFGEVTTAGTRWRMRSRQLRHGSGRGRPANFNLWKLNPTFGGVWNASITLWTGDAADEVLRSWTRPATDSESDGKQFRYHGIHHWQVSSALFAFDWEADVRAALVGSLLPRDRTRKFKFQVSRTRARTQDLGILSTDSEPQVMVPSHQGTDKLARPGDHSTVAMEPPPRALGPQTCVATANKKMFYFFKTAVCTRNNMV